jgi:hypothetical protein
LKSLNLADEPATCSVIVMYFKELLSSPHPVAFRVPGMEFKRTMSEEFWDVMY